MARKRHGRAKSPPKPKETKQLPSPILSAPLSPVSAASSEDHVPPTSTPRVAKPDVYDVRELEELLAKWPEIPPQDHDAVLLKVLESAVAQVGFETPHMIDIYVYFIYSIRIRSEAVQASAIIAFFSCMAKEQYTIAETIISSIVRSVRLVLTKPLNASDIRFLCGRIEDYPPQFAVYVEQLANENNNVRYHNIFVPDREKIVTTTADLSAGFTNEDQLLEEVDRIDTRHPATVRQVKLLLDVIFIMRNDLVRSRATDVARVVQKIGFCPGSSIVAIKLLADRVAQRGLSKTIGIYALTLILLQYLDLRTAKVVSELEEVVSLLTPAEVADSPLLANLLGTFKGMYRGSEDSEFRPSVRMIISTKIVELIKITISYQRQLELVEFLEDLEGATWPLAVYATFCSKAEGLGIINRVCAMLLVNSKKGGVRESIRRVITQQVEKRSLKPNEIKMEYPHLYRCMHLSNSASR